MLKTWLFLLIRAVFAEDILHDLEDLAKGIFDEGDSSERDYTTDPYPRVTEHESSNTIKIIALLTYVVAMAIAIYALYRYKCKKMCMKEPEREVLPRARSNSLGSEVSVHVVHTPEGTFTRRLSDTWDRVNGVEVVTSGNTNNNALSSTSRSANNRRRNSNNTSSGASAPRSANNVRGNSRNTSSGSDTPSSRNNRHISAYNTGYNDANNAYDDPPPSYEEVIANERNSSAFI